MMEKTLYVVEVLSRLEQSRHADIASDAFNRTADMLAGISYTRTTTDSRCRVQ